MHNLCPYHMIMYNILFITGRVDYEKGPYNVTIPANENTIKHKIKIFDDKVCETDETFKVQINISPPFRHVFIIGSIHMTTVTIKDNDSRKSE